MRFSQKGEEIQGQFPAQTNWGVWVRFSQKGQNPKGIPCPDSGFWDEILSPGAESGGNFLSQQRAGACGSIQHMSNLTVQKSPRFQKNSNIPLFLPSVSPCLSSAGNTRNSPSGNSSSGDTEKRDEDLMFKS